MDGPNLVIHIAALLAFLFLIAALVKCLGRQRFIRRCFTLAAADGPGFCVMPPVQFIAELAGILGLPISEEATFSRKEFVRCTPGVWLRFCSQHQIRQVSVCKGSDKLLITIETSTLPQDAVDWQVRLAAALEDSVQVSITGKGA